MFEILIMGVPFFLKLLLLNAHPFLTRKISDNLPLLRWSLLPEKASAVFVIRWINDPSDPLDTWDQPRREREGWGCLYEVLEEQLGANPDDES